MAGISRPSPELLAANARMLAMRQQLRQVEQHTPLKSKAVVDLPDLSVLPTHLGWGSATVTAVLRRSHPPTHEDTKQAAHNNSSHPHEMPDAAPSRTAAALQERRLEDWVKLYPDIGLGMLRQELAAAGRLWLMFRYLDQEGRGVLSLDWVRQTLTGKSALWRLCGKRQLRNLLHQGEDIYWTRDKSLIWLRSAAKVAGALGVQRLTGCPVSLPISTLLTGVGAFRAHLYAAFHSGRSKEMPFGQQAAPLARKTLTSLCGVGRSSQRTYENRTGIRVQTNFAIGEVVTREKTENRTWEHGPAVYELTDSRGQQGKPGQTYMAWQLPNSYIGRHKRRPKGQQRQINRKLKDLVKQGTPGNVGMTGEAAPLKQGRRYFVHGRAAAHAREQSRMQTLYWRTRQPQNGRFHLWQVMEA